MEKKADFGARTLVTIMLTILGFVILLFFLMGAINTGSVDKEACHQSVILRGTVPNLAESFVPLNCKTEKICITSKLFGGKCDDFENSKGITYIRVNKKEQVEKAIAESMIDCWSMMGEGKLSLFQQYFAGQMGFGSIYPSCVVCSRIAFDKESLAKNKIDLSEMNVERYMETHAIGSETISYMDYISGSTNAKVKVSENLVVPNITYKYDNGKIVGINKNEQGSETIKTLTNEPINKELESKNDELAILFTQISSPKQGESLINILKFSAGIGAASGSVFGFTSTVKVGAQATKATINACKSNPYVAIGCSVVAIGAIFYQQASVAENRNIAAGKCSDVILGDAAREGCSVVRTVNYNQSSLESYCAVIESST